MGKARSYTQVEFSRKINRLIGTMKKDDQVEIFDGKYEGRTGWVVYVGAQVEVYLPSLYINVTVPFRDLVA